MRTTITRFWKTIFVWLAVFSMLAVMVAPALGATDYGVAGKKALGWVRSQQQSDGSFSGFGPSSTIDALLAIIAVRVDPASFAKGGNTPVTFLQSKAAELAKTPGGAGKLLIAVSALGLDGKSFGGVNLFEAIGINYPPSGHYGQDTIGHAFAMLGLAAAGQTVPPKAAIYLKSVQATDGGWSFSGDTKAGSSDTNTTAVAIQALVAAGEDRNSPELQKARTYLASQQNPDGGYPYQKGGQNGSDSDVNSSAYVAQALLALGEDASKPLDFIVSLQRPQDDAFDWMKSQPGANAVATYQAIPALMGRTLLSPAPQAVPSPTPFSKPAITPVPAEQPQPGMPKTGDPANGYLPTLIAAGLLSGLGLLIRRRQASK